MSLSSEQIRHYREHGYVAPIDVMSRTRAAVLAARLEQAERDHPDQIRASRRNNAHLAFPFLAELALEDTIVDAAQSLVGPDMTLWSSVLFIKEPDSAAYVSWHQDAMYMALEPDNFVTAWVALTPSTRESGCVSVIPGTHRGARLRHDDTFADDNILTRGQSIEDVDASLAVDLVLQPGQMSLHHPWLVHGSQPNHSSRRRIGVALQSYLGADVRPTRGVHHVMHVRGRPVQAPFLAAPAPVVECGPDAVAVREAADAAFADVLYQGAARRRAL